MRRSKGPLARTTSLSEQIFCDLRDRLQRGSIREEQRLIDNEIAQHYGTSRMPVREALLRLVNEGYLVGTSRGFLVPSLTSEDIRDIFEVRKLLEPHAAASAARALTADARRDLTAALSEARAALKDTDTERFIAANIAFRAAWLSCITNERLTDTLGRFVAHVQTVRLQTLRDAGTRKTVLKGMERLHRTLTTQDAKAAHAAMRQFMADAEKAISNVQRSDVPPAAAGILTRLPVWNAA